MIIKQLEKPEIEALELKAKGMRDKIPTADYLDALELSYQATRIETWVQIQKGNLDGLKAKLESLPDDHDPRTGAPRANPSPYMSQITKRQYKMPFHDRHDRNLHAVYEAVNRRTGFKEAKPLQFK